MVLIRTPLRVSLMGGGTDLPAFFHRSRGRVVCTAITRYIYLWIRARSHATVAPPHGFDLACATRWDDASESILQASLQVCPQAVDVSVTTFTDVPAGNGLGSSSSFTVGVLHGLHAFRGEAPSAETLAAEACQVEIERLGKRIGVQDQYIAAYGGLRELTFERDGRVRAEEVLCSSGTRLALRRRLIVIFTGVQRPSGVLDDVIRDMESNEGVLQSMAERASALASDLRAGNVDEASRVIASGWEMKRRLANAISTPELDDIYIRAIAAGALGGKVLGAGGGGCLLLSVRPARRRDVLEALSDFTELVFDFEPRGSVRLA